MQKFETSSKHSSPATSPRASRPILFSPPFGSGLKRNSSLLGGSHTSLKDLDGLSLTTLSSSASASTASSAANSPYCTNFKYFSTNGYKEEELQKKHEIAIHVIKYVENSTRDEDLAAYIIKFTSDFYDSIYKVCQKLPSFISYRAHNDRDKQSHRRYSLLSNKGTPIATGKWPPLSSKTNPIDVIGKGHIMRDSDLQFKTTSPMDNNTSGALPIENTSYLSVLTRVYQQDISKSIEKVYKHSGLICWEEKIQEYKEFNNSYELTGHMVSKFYIQEAERLYSIIDNLEKDIYIFNAQLTTTITLHFIFKRINFKVNLNDLINPPEQMGIANFHINTLQDFKEHIESYELQDFHAPLWRLNQDNKKYIPVMAWCGPYGHITGDADPHHFTRPFSMPRIAYYGIFNGKTADSSKFMNGFKLLKARLYSANKNIFIEYMNTCDFDLSDYMHPQEIEYIKDPDSHYINYLDPKHHEYSFYINFTAALENTIIKYEQNPELLKMVGESDLNSIITQCSLNHPMSYHAGEDLNPHASDFGVVLSCLPNFSDKKVISPRFIVTENEASYLALLFSDSSILQNMLFGVNAQWLRNRDVDQYLSEQWLDLIEVQALNAAQISKFEFEMYLATIIKIFDRRGPNDNTPNATIEYAIAVVTERLNDTRIIIDMPNMIKNKLGLLYQKYFAQAATVAMKISDHDSSNDDGSEFEISPGRMKGFFI